MGEALDAALKQIERMHGAGTVMRLGSDEVVPVEVVPTGSAALDIALGVGGLPRGRIVEIYGPESGGKTTLALHVAAEAQAKGGTVAFIDAEHAFDPIYARAIGVDTDNLLVSQPENGEQALDIAEKLVQSGEISVLVVDSVAALVPRAELEGEMGQSHIGLQARLMSQAMRKLAGVLNRTGTLAIFINQIREKVGVMYGSPETQPGGRALKYYSSVRIDVRRTETLGAKDDSTGIKVRAKVVKNKVAPPFRQAEFDIEFGKGISRAGNVVDMAIAKGVFSKGGAWLSYGEHKWQGREAAKEALSEDPELMEEIRVKVMQDGN